MMTDSQKLDLLLQQMCGVQENVTQLNKNFISLKDEVLNLKQEVAMLKQEVAVLKQDVAVLKQDVAVLKQDVAELKTDVQDLKERTGKLEEEVKAMKLHMENVTDRNISLLAENHLSLMDKLNQSVKVADTSLIYSIKVNNLAERVDRLEEEFHTYMINHVSA